MNITTTYIILYSIILLTGAWTGALAASFLDMGFKTTTVAVIAGVAIAGTLIGGPLHILGL